ncbi:MFS transporter [Streptomyces xiaopingdaonensis]|uniref:MFS transporter n=1 Tax=Streptomyces xiaopingdaonensis TaxID=1565415 RepID=UPI0003639B68|nr:MFS transporter [Streptomyces xiaopingdaonensis]
MTTVQQPQASEDGEEDGAAPTDRAAAPGSSGAGPPGAGRLRGVLAAFGRTWRRPAYAAALLAAALHLLWLWLFASGGGDLAAQDAWAEFSAQHPGSAYNLAWYGGMHPVSYSVVSPYIMAAIGVRTTLILAGVLSAWLLGLVLERRVERALLPALWGALAFACNAASGRVTFALGVLFGLAAVAVIWAWPRRLRASGRGQVPRALATVLFACLATAGSPVAGLFLEVVAGALLLSGRRKAAVALAVGPPVVVAFSAFFFPFQGTQPMPLVSLVFPVLCSLAVLVLVPREWRTVRLGAAVYGLGTILTWAIPSQLGSNVERLGLLFGAVALLAAVPKVVGGWRSRRGAVMVVALVVVMGWQISKPVWDIARTTPDPVWATSLAPLVDQLERRDADKSRVEVVPAASHRESSALAPYVNLARGWNRQADRDRNPLFYDDGSLTPATYHEWLRRWAVRYVVLPEEERPDGAAKREAALVRSGLPYLREVWSDSDWRLYKVRGAQPLVPPPAEVERAGPEGVTVKVPRAGEVRLRVPWSPWLSVVDADEKPYRSPATPEQNVHGCLRKAEPTIGGPPPEGKDEPVLDTWTVLDAPAAGTYRITAPYRVPRGTTCPEPQEAGEDAESESAPRSGVP